MASIQGLSKQQCKTQKEKVLRSPNPMGILTWERTSGRDRGFLTNGENQVTKTMEQHSITQKQMTKQISPLCVCRQAGCTALLGHRERCGKYILCCQHLFGWRRVQKTVQGRCKKKK